MVAPGGPRSGSNGAEKSATCGAVENSPLLESRGMPKIEAKLATNTKELATDYEETRRERKRGLKV